MIAAHSVIRICVVASFVFIVVSSCCKDREKCVTHFCHFTHNYLELSSWWKVDELYTIYEKGTTDTYKAFINNEEFDKASVGVTWDITNMQLTYVVLTHDLFTDYSPFLGKTQKEVKSMIKDYQPFLEDKNQLAFGISDGKVDLVCCYYTFDFVNTYETAQAVITQLNNSLKTNDVHAYLAKKYEYLENESSNAEKVYTDMKSINTNSKLENKRVLIDNCIFDGNSGLSVTSGQSMV